MITSKFIPYNDGYLAAQRAKTTGANGIYRDFPAYIPTHLSEDDLAHWVTGVFDNVEDRRSPVRRTR